MKEGISILTCPCCNGFPTIRHNICIEGSEASINCRCGLSLTKWDDYNSYCAEKAAIKAWDKIPKDPRKEVKVERENE